MKYIKFTCVQDGTTIQLKKIGDPYSINLYYSYDANNWIEYNFEKLCLYTDYYNKVYFTSKDFNSDFSRSSEDYYQFEIKGNVRLEGAITSLLNPNEYCNITKPYCFYNLFRNCDISYIGLNFTETVSPHCFENMFYSCQKLTLFNYEFYNQTPILNYADSCCKNMFNYCINLSETNFSTYNSIGRTVVLAEHCCENMFANCLKLGSDKILYVPYVVNSQLADYCYKGMFQNSGIRDYSYIFYNSVYTTNEFYKLAPYCFENMFKNCSNLSGSSVQVGLNFRSDYIELKHSCFKGMFQGCTSLLNVPIFLIPQDAYLSIEPNCYQNMFKDCINLVYSVDYYYNDLLRPDTGIIPNNACESMFEGCWSLDETPQLTAETIESEGYKNMFKDCISLTSVSEIGGQFLSKNCYANMFKNCRSLIDVNELIANILNSHCYDQMFYNCIALSEAPTIEATALAEYCCVGMFQGCTSLISAPVMNAIELTNNCYYDMFYDCTSLSTVTAKFTDWKTSDFATRNWLKNVNSNGEFINKTGLSSIKDASHIPGNWNISEIAETIIYYTSDYTKQNPWITNIIGSLTFEYLYDWIYGSVEDTYKIKIIEVGTSISSISLTKENWWVEDNYLSSLKSVLIPNSVKRIEDNSFYKCGGYDWENEEVTYGLESINIPDSISSIGNNAFLECYALKQINLNEHLSSIGEYAFSKCYSLKDIVLPSNINYGVGVFSQCINLTNAIFKNEIDSIPDDFFQYCTSLKTVVMPEKCKKIGRYAFTSTAIKNISLPNTLSSIDTNAFWCCDYLKNLIFPDSLKTIGDSAFESCPSLTDVSFPSSLSSIGECAFYNCKNLKYIFVPKSVTSIGASAFAKEDYVLNNTENRNQNYPKITAYFDDRTLDEVQSMKNYPWGLLTSNIYVYDYKGLTFKALENNSTIMLQNVNGEYSYSFNGKSWKDYTLEKTLNLKLGQKVFFAAKSFNYTCNNDNVSQPKFVMTGKIEASGNIQSLLNKDLDYKEVPDRCFQYLFNGCTSLTKAPDLPTSTLGAGCYYSMFEGCTSLTAAPLLSASTLNQYCYHNMFGDCTSLVYSPDLSATTMKKSCYQAMFFNCSSLKSAPKIYGSALAENCYAGMFEGCTSLVEPSNLSCIQTLAPGCCKEMFRDCISLSVSPDLLIEDLADECYIKMFEGCSSLIYAPYLPAEDLVSYCYYEMFKGCSSLCAIVANFTSWNDDLNATTDWVSGVASNGEFENPNSIEQSFGDSRIPTGWTYQQNDRLLLKIEYIPESGLKSIKKIWQKDIITKNDLINLGIKSKNTTGNIYYISKIQLGKTIKILDEYTFGISRYYNLSTIVFPSSILSAGYQSLDVYSDNKQHIDFYIDDLTSWCNIKKYIKYVNDVFRYTYEYTTFYIDNVEVSSLTFNKDITEIREACFYYSWNQLTSVNFNNDVSTIIGHGAFTECKNLAYGNIPLGITSIGSNAFYECTNLSLYFNDRTMSEVKAMNNYSWGLSASQIYSNDKPCKVWNDDMQREYEVYPENGVLSWDMIYNQAGNPTPQWIISVYISQNVSCITPDALNDCWNLKKIEVNPANKYYSVSDGILYNKDQTELVTYPVQTNDHGCIILKEGISALQDCCFSNNPMSAIILPESLSVIGENVFTGTYQLSNIVLPDSLVEIKANAFEDALFSGKNNQIIIPKSVTKIDSEAFGTAAYRKECQKDYIYYFTGRTMAQVRQMENFPWGLTDDEINNKVLAEINEYMGLCFEAKSVNSGVLLEKWNNPSITVSIQYSTDSVNWFDYEVKEEESEDFIELPKVGDKVWFRAGEGGNTAFASSDGESGYSFDYKGTLAASGNVMSLLDQTLQTFTIDHDYCFRYLFSPLIYGTDSLITAPLLPATTLALNCYNGMFINNTKLSSAPLLPATELKEGCYNRMFEGCTSLTKAPNLYAPNLVDRCYKEMFIGCTSLSSVAVGFKDWNSSALENWLANVNSTGEFKCPTALGTNDTITRGASNCPQNWNVSYSGLCFTTQEADNKIYFETAGTPPEASLQYSTDSVTWNDYAFSEGEGFGQEISLPNIGDKVWFRAGEGGNTALADDTYDNYHTIYADKPIKASGNVMSLLDQTMQTIEINHDGCFVYLFNSNEQLLTAPDLPALSLTTYCYGNMFSGCLSLSSSPDLPALELKEGSYNGMFYWSGLTSIPNLFATSIGDYCYCYMFSECDNLTAIHTSFTTLNIEGYTPYSEMFEYCISLIHAPDLLATTLCEYDPIYTECGCYYGMFLGCISLIKAPLLPATELKENCYEYMFYECISLIKAPELPTTTLKKESNEYMFYDNFNLQYVSINANNWVDTSTTKWLQNVFSIGKFKCPTALGTNDTITRGVSNCPQNWIVVNK